MCQTGSAIPDIAGEVCPTVDISLLRTFLEVARTRHFGKAAAHLHVTQSAVSARIKLLESSLGAVLFERRRHDIRLTPAGERLLSYAESIVRTWSRARQEVSRGEGPNALLRLGCPLDLWPLLARDWVSGLRQTRPALPLRVEILPADLLPGQLAEGQLDLILSTEPSRDLAFDTLAVGTFALILVADRPGLSAAEGVGQGYIQVDWGPACSVVHAARFPDAPAATLRLSQGLPALDLLLRIGGSAYLPRPLVQEPLGEGTLYPVAGAPVMEVEIYAAVRAGEAGQGVLAEALALLRGPGP